MADTRIETLDDAELDQVSGGAGISITIGDKGVSIAGPLGELHVPNPLAVAGKLVGGTLGAAGAVLEGAGHAIGKLGDHFG